MDKLFEIPKKYGLTFQKDNEEAKQNLEERMTQIILENDALYNFRRKSMEELKKLLFFYFFSEIDGRKVDQHYLGLRCVNQRLFHQKNLTTKYVDFADQTVFSVVSAGFKKVGDELEPCMVCEEPTFFWDLLLRNHTKDETSKRSFKKYFSKEEVFKMAFEKEDAYVWKKRIYTCSTNFLREVPKGSVLNDLKDEMMDFFEAFIEETVARKKSRTVSASFRRIFSYSGKSS